MSTKEAATRWGKKDDSSIRHRRDEFPDGTLRKVGRDWVVTREGMEFVFGLSTEGYYMERQSFIGLQKEKRVEHELLGKGTVTAISPTHDVVVQVLFDNYQGSAQWMVDATLVKIESDI
ncbi:helix-turn-helix domain-containing protein [Paenibacillus sp. NAIST15-1]|uniref:helix-turn-helix domain-containing protein n=1 Tax=Paenibacillus sp. NAIST15-1 TaxID=1605994 RepID=UPI001587FC09|nr:helix-turn-helix domain-containing protein [Paenibacillus sp. NAIST15-1]